MNIPPPQPLQPARADIPRLIVCAAMRHPGTLRVIAGVRHLDRIMQEQFHPADDKHFWEQGFLDNGYKFLTREEAWPVAEAAGQIRRRVGGDGAELFSENLY